MLDELRRQHDQLGQDELALGAGLAQSERSQAQLAQNAVDVKAPAADVVGLILRVLHGWVEERKMGGEIRTLKI